MRGHRSQRRLIILPEDGVHNAVELSVITIDVVDSLIQCGLQRLWYFAIINNHGNYLRTSLYSLYDTGVKFFPDPRFMNAISRKHDYYGIGALQTLIKNLLNETVTRIDLPLIYPCFNAVCSQTRRELDNKTVFVFCGMADKYFRIHFVLTRGCKNRSLRSIIPNHLPDC